MNMYDSFFKMYTKTYFQVEYNNDPNFQLQFKAQGIAESRLIKTAKSPVGAMGVMQIMPDTFEELLTKVRPISQDPFNPETSIQMGIFYNRSLYNQQTSPRPMRDRLLFTFASYNAGLGNILKAQKYANKYFSQNDNNLWDNIKIVAKHIKSWKSSETLEYIDRILLIRSQLISQK